MQFDKITLRIGSLIQLKLEYEERYIILHKHTFPGVLSQIHKVNIRNYSIFLLDGILFSYYEYIGKDFKNDLKAIADETTKEWWKLTDPMQEPLPARKPGEWWAEMKSVFCMEKMTVPSTQALRSAYKVKTNINENELILSGQSMSIDLLAKPGLQNCNLFVKEGMLYLYFEYTGNADLIDQVSGSLTEEINKCLIGQKTGTWHKMKEVFHTD